MSSRRLPNWVGSAALGVVGVVALALFAVAWLSSNQIRSNVLLPVADDRPYDVEVTRTPPARLVTASVDEPPRDGIWGFENERTYAQLTSLLRRSEEGTEWAATSMVGEFTVGSAARVDVDAYPGNPTIAFGLGYNAVRAPGELGPLPAWLIDGRRSTWVIVVHGKGTDRRTQALRMIPALAEAGFPVLVVTYRNDDGAPPSPTGLRSWGLEEWRDLDAAVGLADREGAQGYVLVGHDLGAEIVSMFLHESDRVGKVRGVIFDSPVLDLEGTLDSGDGPLERLVGEMGQQFARFRFDMEWSELDQVARADQFDVPILAMHGVRDTVVPISITEAFATARPDLVRLVRFEQGGHGDLWNIDRARYERELGAFLEGILEENG